MIGNRWSASVRQWVAIGIGALLLLGLWILWPFLTPLSLALLLTYILNPLVNRLEREAEWPRTMAALAVYLLLIVLIALVPVRVLPFLVDQGQELAPPLADAALEVGEAIAGLGTVTILGQSFTPFELYQQLSDELLTLGTGLASSSVNIVFGVATTFVSTVLWLLFILVISFYLVRDTPNITRYLWGMVPRAVRPEVYYLTRRINRTWNAFLRGQLLLSLSIFALTTTVLLLLGVSQAFFLGFVAAVLNLVPNLGPIMASLPAILLALVQGSSHIEVSNLFFALIVTLAYVGIQQIEGNVLVPRIIGGSVNLHPTVVLLGAIIGLSTVGLLGIFLAAPTLATLRILMGYAYRKLLDPTYTPPEVILPPSIAAIPDPVERQVPALRTPREPRGVPRYRRWINRLRGEPRTPRPHEESGDA